MFATIEPVDVYNQVAELRQDVNWILTALYWVVACSLTLFVAVVAQIVVKTIIFSRAMAQIGVMVRIAEQHAALTDGKAERTVHAIEDAKQEAKTAARAAAAAVRTATAEIKDEVPKRVVEEIKSATASDSLGDSGKQAVVREPAQPG